MIQSEYFPVAEVLQTVRRAAQLCTQVRATLNDEGSLSKSDNSPVTIADYGAQAVILHQLAKITPEIPVVAEEDAAALRDPANASLWQQVRQAVARVCPEMTDADILAALDRGNYTGGSKGAFWTLDPIDGTKGFLRNDQYAIALALIDQGQPVFAVLGCPQLSQSQKSPEKIGCLLVAAQGQGAFQYDLGSETGQPVTVSSQENIAESCFCESVESGHSRHDWASAVATGLGITRPSVRMDSQCKYAAIARGDAEVYLRLPTRPGYEEKIWDHAAGCLVVEEAGGTVSDTEGKPLDFGQGRTLKNNSGIVATHGRWHSQVIKTVRTSKP